MKKNTLLLLVLVVIASFVALGLNSPVWAQSKEKPVLQKSQRKAVLGKTGKLPDLVVARIELTKKCEIKVTIKNQGKGGVPSKAYDPLHGVIIQATRSNAGWGGYHLSMIDPAKKLKRPGASVSYVGFKRALRAGENLTLKVAILDPNNTAKESNTKNNSLTARLVCKKPLPDLIVSDIKLIKDCKIEITIKNIGAAGVPASGYDLHKGAGIQMYKGGKAWGGIRLGAVDRSGRLKTPGTSVKHVWFPKAANLALGAGTHSIKVIADNNNAVAELNEKNNSKTVRLVCKKPVTRKQKGMLQKEVSKLPAGVQQKETLQMQAPKLPAGARKIVTPDLIVTN